MSSSDNVSKGMFCLSFFLNYNTNYIERNNRGTGPLACIAYVEQDAKFPVMGWPDCTQCANNNTLH